MNPLGNRALYLGASTYRIHGTDAPWTIGTAVSKGCIRMYNQDVADLYPRAQVGAKVVVTYQRFGAMAASSGSGGFSLFGSDDPPERPRKRTTRPKSTEAKGPAKSAAAKSAFFD